MLLKIDLRIENGTSVRGFFVGNTALSTRFTLFQAAIDNLRCLRARRALEGASGCRAAVRAWRAGRLRSASAVVSLEARSGALEVAPGASRVFV